MNGINSKLKTAIVIGATGLVGSHVLELLLEDERYDSVKVFHRRTTGINHPKLEEHIVEFDDIEKWKYLVIGDHLFSALGTTLKKAGSKKAQYKIDFTYQYEVAKAAFENQVPGYALVSSIGANAKSSSFYTRIKGELEGAVLKFRFKELLILRPSFLDGDREEFRMGERVGIVVASLICKLPGLKKYHPIKASTVAKGMIDGLQKSQLNTVYESNEIHALCQ